MIEHDEGYPFHINRKIAVVVPAYNEERFLFKTLLSIPGWVYQIIVVDDGSTDTTADIAQCVKKNDPRVTYERHESNRGVGAAICTGYERAKTSGCDIAVVMAGDAQMDPQDLERLLFPVVANCVGYAKGNRLLHPEASSMPIVRRIGTTVLAKLTCAIAGIDDLGDMQCGYTALNLNFLPLLKIDTMYERYGYPNDIVLRLAEANIAIADVPVRPIYDGEASGLKPHKVVLPISRILMNGLKRRAEKEVKKFRERVNL